MLNLFKKKKTEPKNLKEVLAQFRELQDSFERISRQLEALKKNSEFFVQKVGLVRFNPFSEVGGDQSFSLALLDSRDSGIVITSLYTREGNRVYGKQIKNGQPSHALSEEEKQAIAEAKNGNKKSKNGSEAANSGSNGAH
ncbi:MAG: hypothetical protein G01um101430_474 [Parcubacteria group bacterium Gr01-1014_30]|nr:MAG: hypothetical protein G01um101430_474 [Parcubacteria group bacterium Gr01-1014_30]